MSIYKFFTQKFRLNPEQQNVLGRLCSGLEPSSVAAKTLLLEEGHVADKLYIILKGAARLFFYDDGRDISFQFFLDGTMVASFDSLYGGTPSLYSLETIEPCQVIAIPKARLMTFVETNPVAREMFEEILISRFHNYQKLFLSRIKDSPQRRYENLIKESPEILKRIPQHYIASYLGITPVSLSRIRNRR